MKIRSCIIVVVWSFGCSEGPETGRLEQEAIRQSSLDIIGPERVYETITRDSDGAVGSQVPGVGTYWTLAQGAHRRSEPWALGLAEQIDVIGMDGMEAIHHSMNHLDHLACGQALLDRAFSAGKPIENDVRWSMYLHWSVEGDRLVADGVVMKDKPPFLDQEALACYRDALQSATLPLDNVPQALAAGGFFTEWSICIRLSGGSPPEKAKAPHPIAQAAQCWTWRWCFESEPLCHVWIDPQSRTLEEDWNEHCDAPWPSGWVPYFDPFGAARFRDCDSMTDSMPGSIGADGCVTALRGRVEPGRRECFYAGEPRFVGAGCCIVGCDPRAPGCQPQ